MITNNSLQEYYIKLQGLYNNAVNMLTAINQSLTSAASEVTVPISDSDDSTQTVRIPSFVYLENKLETISNNIDNLFNMPESGEAWFENVGNMYKLQLVRANTAPAKPEISNYSTAYASLHDNTILKDLVFPHVHLRLDISNLTDNIERMFMRKLIIYDVNVYNALTTYSENGYVNSFSDYLALLDNFVKGVDYDYYDSDIDLPIKEDVYYSAFEITSVLSYDESDNPYTDPTTNHLMYDLQLSTLYYGSQEDSAVSYLLKTGDYLTLGNEMVIYKVNAIDTSSNIVTLEEMTGHITLQSFEENSEMVLSLYNRRNYDSYHYVEVPLEENPYIIVFLGTIYNNVRSILSQGYAFNLNEIKMYDKNGNPIVDDTGSQYNYVDYYNKYCTNIGDLILGLTEAAYPQLSNFTPAVLSALQNGDDVKEVVTSTINATTILEVVPINKHLLDDTEIDEITSLNTQKTNISTQLNSVKENINTIYNQLATNDFSDSSTELSQESLKATLNTYYNERLTLEKQFNAIVDEINIKSDSLTLGLEDTKYRIRGILDSDLLDAYITTSLGDTLLAPIGIDVEYKYKSVSKDTTNLTVIDSKTFTNWNKMSSIDKERAMVYNTSGSSFILAYEDYNTTDNKIKWNQIDIPIQQGEDVIIRVRYKYNVGQPFVNIYSPWSDEITVIFPDEYKNNVELSTIITENADDTTVAAFSNMLIDYGYEDHNNNKIIDGDNTFYHMPENIYSGFLDSNSKLISLKDKLSTLTNDVDKCKDALEEIKDSELEVRLEYDKESIVLSSEAVNSIQIYNTDHITGKFIRKEMNIVFKNTGSSVIKLYSIFPGSIDKPLLLCNEEFQLKYLPSYERAPIIVAGATAPQLMGQWLYFRTNDPFTDESIYAINRLQNKQDTAAAINANTNVEWISGNSYMHDDNGLMPLGYRNREQSSDSNNITWTGLYCNNGTSTTTVKNAETLADFYNNSKISFFMYPGNDITTNTYTNKYLLRYEDIYGTTYVKDNIMGRQLTPEVNISDFITAYKPTGFDDDVMMTGAFLFPELSNTSILATDNFQYDNNSFKKLAAGKTLAIPVVFEFYLPGLADADDNVLTSIEKSLYFDIRPSVLHDPVHYMIKLTANYDSTAIGNIYDDYTKIVDED